MNSSRTQPNQKHRCALHGSESGQLSFCLRFNSSSRSLASVGASGDPEDSRRSDRGWAGESSVSSATWCWEHEMLHRHRGT